MGRKCSHCGMVGHNSRTCTSHKHKTVRFGGSFRLFGVEVEQIPEAMGCFSSSSSSSSSCCSGIVLDDNSEKLSSGYLSDCLIPKTHERKKGVAWSEEEHRVFLEGLEKLGKGNWGGISRKYVKTRTPTQVASHAQKYFLRLTKLTTRSPSHFHLNNVGGDESRIQVVESSKICNQTNQQTHSDYDAVLSHEPIISFQPTNSSASMDHNHQLPDLRLTLNTPTPLQHTQQPSCRSIAIGAIPVTSIRTDSSSYCGTLIGSD